MRSAGFALLLAVMGVSSGLAQAPGVPTAPASPPTVPTSIVPADQKLDGHLANWEKTMGGLKSFYFDLTLKRTDPAAGIFKGEKDYTGMVLGMKPNFARLRLEFKDNPKDYEAFICNDEAVYAYNGLQKTVTRHKLPDPKKNSAGNTGNLVLDFIRGMKAKDLKERFELKLFMEDDSFIYLDIKPRFVKDKQDFQQLRLALWKPNTRFDYLPAAIYLVRPNGEIEDWKLTNHKTNIPKLDPQVVFQYDPVPGFLRQDAPEQKAPAPVKPGQTTPPVRSGRP